MSVVALLFIILAVCIVLGVTIAASLGAAGCIALIQVGIDLTVVPQRMFGAINSFPLLAIVFFVLSGELMLKGGISEKLVNMAKSLLKRVPNALMVIDVVTCAFFGALSGSSLATTAAIGGVMHPQMVKEGYDEGFSAALQAASGILGVLIPPSIPLVIYAVTSANTSAGDLFLAVVPGGLMMMVAFITVSYIVVRREKMVIRKDLEIPKFGASLQQGIWALLMPVIILGTIYGGICTPTESAIIATVYAFLVGAFVYRCLTWRNVLDAFITTIKVSGSVMFLVAAATFFSWVMTYLNIPRLLTASIMAVVKSKYTFLLLTTVILLIAGMLVDTSAAILLLVPLLLPVAMSFGIEPIHMGILTVVNLALGNVTPPFGATMFVSASMTGVKVEVMYRRVIPFCLAGIVVILLVTYIPALSSGFFNMIVG